MSTFDILVPVIALAVAGVGVLVLHIQDKRLDRGDKPHRSGASGFPLEHDVDSAGLDKALP